MSSEYIILPHRETQILLATCDQVGFWLGYIDKDRKRTQAVAEGKQLAAAILAWQLAKATR